MRNASVETFDSLTPSIKFQITQIPITKVSVL